MITRRPISSRPSISVSWDTGSMKNKIFLAIAIAVAFCSCQPRVITQIQTEYVYRDRVQVDTTFIHDSVHIKEVVKGDTVRVVEYRDRYHYDFKYILKTDTLCLVDSVLVEKTKEVKVEKPLPWHKKLRIGAFWWLLGLCVVGFRREIRKLFLLL